MIKIKVEDGGLDQDLSTTEDNASVTQNLTVTVNPVNDIPALDALQDMTIEADSGEYKVDLTGITAGIYEAQPLRVTAQSSDSGVVSNQSVVYASPQTTGMLKFSPVPFQTGETTITVTVEDAGLDDDFETTADNKSFSRSFKVTVAGINETPTLSPIDNVTISEDTTERLVNISGITAGGSDSQPLRITTSSSNTDLLPAPGVTYTSPERIGTLHLIPAADQSGTAVITVTAEDGGLDKNLNTPGDNGRFQRTFEVLVTPVNDVPELHRPDNITILEDAVEQTVNLTGITAGGGEVQPLYVSATSSNTDLIPNVIVSYTSPESTGTLRFRPQADQFGTSVITLTVEDGGLDGKLATSEDNLETVKSFEVHVTPMNDAPVLAALPAISIAEDATVHGNGTPLKNYVTDIDSDLDKIEFRIANMNEIDSRFGLSIGMDSDLSLIHI